MRLHNPVTPAMVNAEAGRRIEARYPLYRQLNIIRGGGEDLAAMSDWIDAVRGAAHALTSSTPIPGDYAADRHWRTDTTT